MMILKVIPAGMVTRETLLATVLTVVMITAAGCAGWGTDGPADGSDDAGDDASDDLEEADGEAQADEGDGGGGEDSSGDGSTDSSDSDGDKSDSSESGDGVDRKDDETSKSSTSADSTDSDTSSEKSKSKDKEKDTTGGDSDEKTDETSETGDGDSSDSSDKGDTDSDSDSDDTDSDSDDSEPETHTLTVTVRGPGPDDPVEGMEIEVVTYDGGGESEHVATATTNENGQVTFELENGSYELLPAVDESDELTDFGTHLVGIDGEDEEYQMRLPGAPDGDDDDQVSEPERTLTITVVDEKGEPVSGAAVHGAGPVLSNGVAHEPAGETNEDGVVTLTAYDGEYDIEVQHHGPTVNETVTVDGDTETTITVAQDTDGHTLTVTVTDPNGDPVVNGDVHIVTPDGGEDVASGTTDENGQVTFDLENGDYEVAVSAPDQELHQPSDRRFVTIDDGDEEFSVQLQSSGDDDDKSDTATGIVRVVDQDGEPVEGEPVILSPPGTVEEDQKETRHTDENGEVVIELGAGDPSDAVMYGVEVRDQEQSLGIMSDEHHGVQEVTFNVGTDSDEPNYTATGKITVVDQNGDPVPDEPVTIEFEDGSTEEYQTDENGEVVLEFPKDSADEITTVTATVRGESESMVIETDDEHGVQELTFNVEPQVDSATGVIRVVDDDGEPIEGERVTITPPGTVRESDKEQRVTGENGEVRIELLAGEPTDVVMFTAEVRGEEKTLGIMSDEHTGVQEVEFNPTDRMYKFATVIQVVDENGEPVEGVEVEARHGMLGDDPANDWEVVGETDGSGEVVLVGGSSEPDDVIAQEVRVGDQTITTHLEYERQVEQIEIETNEDEKQNIENGHELVAV